MAPEQSQKRGVVRLFLVLALILFPAFSRAALIVETFEFSANIDGAGTLGSFDASLGNLTQVYVDIAGTSRLGSSSYATCTTGAILPDLCAIRGDFRVHWFGPQPLNLGTDALFTPDPATDTFDLVNPVTGSRLFNQEADLTHFYGVDSLFLSWTTLFREEGGGAGVWLGNVDITVDIHYTYEADVPAPSTLALLVMGVLAFCGTRRITAHLT